MPKGLNIDLINEYYTKLSDQELMRIITEDAHGLVPETREIIQKELKLRNIDDGLINIVDAQNKNYTIEEIDEFCTLIVSLPCPKCKSSLSKLKFAIISQAMSFIILTHYSKKLLIACSSCIKQDNNKALIISCLLGWWGISHGPIRTIQSIINFVKANSLLKKNEYNDCFREFVFSFHIKILNYSAASFSPSLFLKIS